MRSRNLFENDCFALPVLASTVILATVVDCVRSFARSIFADDSADADAKAVKHASACFQARMGGEIVKPDARTTVGPVACSIVRTG